ncbi:hypothetical protein [Mycobacterium basiliense]|uniref:hypothetical protein n=1 Tax=Mycobacterium basiliense TaxID=2094119 RepID=UPI0039EE7117
MASTPPAQSPPPPQTGPVAPASPSTPSSPGRVEWAGRLRNPWTLLTVAAVVVVLVFAARGIWLTLRPETTSAPNAATSAATTSAAAPSAVSADALARLLSSLPLGYAPGTCRTFLPPKDGLARVICDKNVDAGGPSRAIFTLFGETATLRQYFDGLLRTDIMVDCPGQMKSPADWHRPDNAQVGGRVFCAVQDSSPTVAWTNEAQMMMCVAQGDPQGPNLDQLFGWWRKHW